VIVLSTVLRIKRTLDGAEIDKIIWDIEAREALTIERVSAWPTGALARPAFARCDTSVPQPCHVLLQICAVIDETKGRKARRM
jgi:hypothetical protein